MKHSVYVVSHGRVRPTDIIWVEPIAWNAQGEATHYIKQPAFISETKILGGYRYAIRAMTLRLPPSEIPS
jgi:hypothetical protein